MLKRDKRDRIEKLEKRLSDLRAGRFSPVQGIVDPEVKAHIAWFENVYWKLPKHERVELNQAWDTYYRKCAEDRNNMSIPKPNGYDPKIWFKSDYCAYCSEVKQELEKLSGGDDFNQSGMGAGEVW